MKLGKLGYLFGESILDNVSLVQIKMSGGQGLKLLYFASNTQGS